MRLFLLIISILVISWSDILLAQDYGNEFFEDQDLVMDDFDDETDASRGVKDFPATADDGFNYGGIENFADEDLDGGGAIDFGDEAGRQIEKPQAKSDKTAKPTAKPTAKDTSKSSPPPTVLVPESKGFTLGGNVVTQYGAEEVVDPTLPSNASFLPNLPSPVQNKLTNESPYAPLPEDTLAPPAPELPEPNEFAGAPPVPGTRRIMAIGEAPESYRVRAGDTLYDICDQLLDEPNYWPKLWALNPKIRNPHFIYPGIVLRFFPGDDEMPPYLEVVREEDIVPIDRDGIDNSELITENMANLLFEKFIPTVSPVDDSRTSDIPSFGVEDNAKNLEAMTIGVVVPAYYFEEEPEEKAIVVGNREGWGLSGDLEYFIIKEEAGVSVGTIYTIVRPAQTLEIEGFSDDIGQRYEFVAAARVTRKLEDDYAEAQVVYTRLGVKKDDIVIDYRTFKRSVSLASPEISGSGKGTVIGFEHDDQMLGAQGSLVFLSGAFSPNAVVPVYNDARFLPNNQEGSSLPEITRPVATIRIIESSSQASLGYILNSIRAVRVGDFTGKG